MNKDKILVRKTPLIGKIHNQCEGIKVKGEVIELMQDQIEIMSEILIDMAVKNAKDDCRNTIMKKDIEKAFEEFIYNKVVLDDVIEVFKDGLDKLRNIKTNSISSKYLGVQE